nr:DEAD/DEAH box helicase [Alphaproteobacteria bacterium]
MPINLLKKLFGSANDRFLKSLRKTINQINQLEPSVKKLSDQELSQRTIWLKERLKQGEKLDAILPDAFATVREAAVRILGQRHYDVQLIGGMVLNRSMIAEMKTGEGKTLVSVAPMYLNALTGRGVHLVTVNEYLAERDAHWMGQVYNYLGLSVGVIKHGQNPSAKREQYAADIVYGTNNEFGFDYLRDNMATSEKNQVMRDLSYAIVDEVDSILIDEARTPLIISAPAEESTEKYQTYARLVNFLEKETHYKIDEKERAVTLSEEGIKKMEELMGIENIYTEKGFEEVHHIEAALKAKAIFQRDIDYVVKDNEILIVDEFTGRLMPGRRYSDGLHQALEAKENVEVNRETMTLASITFQNFFRLYDKLAGMTGTALTEAQEFGEIYKLDT